MPKLLTIKKTFPCGQPRNNSLLQAVIQHYNTCDHATCKARAEKFQRFFVEENARDAS